VSRSQKGISLNARKLNILAPKSAAREIRPLQGTLNLGIEKQADYGDVGMGVLSDGTPYLAWIIHEGWRA
jgi:hypothetical protein